MKWSNYKDKVIGALNLFRFDEDILRILEDSIEKNQKIFVAGNGGSAAIALHYVCDFPIHDFPSKLCLRDPVLPGIFFCPFSCHINQLHFMICALRVSNSFATSGFVIFLKVQIKIGATIQIG